MPSIMRTILPAVVASAAILSGCTGLPSNAPTAAIVSREVSADRPGGPVLVNMTAALTALYAANDPKDDEADHFFGDGGRRHLTLGPGDTLSISVVEQTGGGLFSTGATGQQGSRLVTLPDMQIDSDGMINFPYLGAIRAAGLSESALSTRISSQLGKQTVQPQIVVHRSVNRNNLITLDGAINKPMQVDLSPAGERILDAISLAGGSKLPPADTMVMLTRARQNRQVRLSTMIRQPRFNIHLQPGDMVTLLASPRRITVVGATMQQSTQTLQEGSDSLIAMLGMTGGLDENSADAKAVYVMRYENGTVLNRLGVPGEKVASEGMVPAVYQFDLGSVDGSFSANNFALRDKDIVVAAASQSIQWAKALKILYGTLQPTAAAASAANRF